MAVEIRYVVVRGEKEVVFADKKEADAYDKMLDISEELFQFMDSEANNIGLSEGQLESLCVLLAQNKDDVSRLLKGTKVEKLHKKEKEKEKNTDENAIAKADLKAI